LQQEFRARIGRLVEALDDGRSEFSVIELGHNSILSNARYCIFKNTPNRASRKLAALQTHMDNR
jgi:hypothetical protein